MEIEKLLIELMNEVGKAKLGAPTGDVTRYYAILFTEVEKMYAFYLAYLYPIEADIPPAQALD